MTSKYPNLITLMINSFTHDFDFTYRKNLTKTLHKPFINDKQRCKNNI